MIVLSLAQAPLCLQLLDSCNRLLRGGPSCYREALAGLKSLTQSLLDRLYSPSPDGSCVAAERSPSFSVLAHDSSGDAVVELSARAREVAVDAAAADDRARDAAT